MMEADEQNQRDSHPDPETGLARAIQSGELAADIRGMIEAARLRVAQTVNAELVLLNWQIGNRIRRDILGQTRAEYGEEIVSTLSRQLSADYGAGFSRQNLFHMIRFAEVWPHQARVAALAQHLGWSHFKEVLYLKNELARQFYAEMCRVERWSVRTLRDRVRGMLFERTAISRQPEATIRQDLQRLREADRLTPELVFRDPYLLDFLGLQDTYSERDFETAKNWSGFCWNSAQISPSSPVRSGSQSATRTSTSICCFTTGVLRGLSRLISSSAASKQVTRARWNYTFGGSTSMTAGRSRKDLHLD